MDQYLAYVGFDEQSTGGTMAKYLIRGNYGAAGVAGLIKEGGSGRRAAVDELVASVGGTVESMYFAFGDTDVYVICDFPDTASAAAVSLTISASGVASASVTPLLTAEDLDAAAKKSPSYRPPAS